MNNKSLMIAGHVLALSGSAAGPYPLGNAPVILQPVKVTAVGYGAMSNHEGYTPGQKRLMAMRAAKLDAYRALAEQVYGVHLAGNTTVGAMTLQNDSFRAYIDATIRGARIVSVTPMADGNYEMVVELILNKETLAAPATSAQPKAVACPGSIGGPVAGCSSNGQFYYME